MSSEPSIIYLTPQLGETPNTGSTILGVEPSDYGNNCGSRRGFESKILYTVNRICLYRFGHEDPSRYRLKFTVLFSHLTHLRIQKIERQKLTAKLFSGGSAVDSRLAPHSEKLFPAVHFPPFFPSCLISKLILSCTCFAIYPLKGSLLELTMSEEAKVNTEV